MLKEPQQNQRDEQYNKALLQLYNDIYYCRLMQSKYRRLF